jgi:hypothetical protein
LAGNPLGLNFYTVEEQIELWDEDPKNPRNAYVNIDLGNFDSLDDLMETLKEMQNLDCE